MKEYRLATWPELRPPHDRTAYRRMVSDMSHRHMTVWQLVEASGLRRLEVQNFVEVLQARGVLAERERPGPGWTGALRFMRAWLRRTWAATVRGG
jgi:hypothetical protein